MEADNNPSEVKDVKVQDKETTTVSFFVDGKGWEDHKMVFNTPHILETVKGFPDGCKVSITVCESPDAEARKMIEDTKDTVIEALEKSIVPGDKIGLEIRKFAQFLIDHSTLRAIGVHAICVDQEDKDAGFGFVATSSDCTAGQAVALVNCGDANIDEFIAKARIEVPGRNGTPVKGTVLTPTAEQVAELG